jgi:hypothetical protein
MASYMADRTRQLEQLLSPLGEAEERRAVSAAIDWTTAQAGGARDLRYRVLGANLRIEKPRRREEMPPRWIRVLIADYTHRRNLEVTVDGAGAVVEGGELAGLQPAFHRDEVREARQIAERDPIVARWARAERSFAGAFAPNADRENRRLVGLRYLAALAAEDQGQSTPLGTVVVDLYGGTVVDIKDYTTAGGA